MAPRIREPLPTSRFEEDMERLSKKISRLEELVDAILEVLCRDPEYLKTTIREKVFAYPLMELPGNPPAILYCSLTEKHVILHFLIIVDTQVSKSELSSSNIM